MLFSRFWYLLLAAVTGLSIAAMTLARSSYEHDRGADASAMLVSDRKLLDEFLRRDARTRIDDLAPVSSNGPLVSALETATRRADDTPAVIGTAITQKLRELNQGLGALRGDILLAVDPRGVVVGRTGIGEGEVGANLGALPLVASAIAGNTRDDLWEISGQAYRMAARPVISQGRYYVGAIVHGMALNDAYATTVAQLAPGASVMFFGPDGMYASFHPVPERGMRRAPAPGVMVDQLRRVREREDWKTRGATEAYAPTAGDPESGVVVFASLPGMIGAAGGGIALARGIPSMPADFLLKASKEDLARVPVGALSGLALLLAAFGWLFIYIEHDTKKNRLLAAFKALNTEGTHIDPLTLGGFARDVAVVANDSIDEIVKREVQRSGGRGVRNVNELESLLNAPATESSQPAPPTFNPGPPMPPMAAPMPPVGAPMPPPAQRPAPPPPPNVRRAQPVQVDEDEQPTNIGPFSQVVKSGAQAIAAAPVVDDEAQHWREVYEQFLAKKRECNESIENLTFEKFSTTLQKNKEQLITKTGCRTVRFQVYVKDAKATLKATPVR
jgi:hypothetical protein